MKLNDMTIADIDQAAAQNAEAYDTMFQKSARAAFNEGACWAYEYLTKEGGNVPAWCSQSEKDYPITADLLKKNGWIANPEEKFFMKQFEVNGITVFFEYNMANKAFFYLDSLIPYPVERLSQIKDIFNVLRVEVKWEV